MDSPPPSYYEQDIVPCFECHSVPCIDGQIDGIDGDGRETSDECPCGCHKEERAEADADDREFEERRDDPAAFEPRICEREGA